MSSGADVMMSRRQWLRAFGPAEVQKTTVANIPGRLTTSKIAKVMRGLAEGYGIPVQRLMALYIADELEGQHAAQVIRDIQFRLEVERARGEE